MTAVWSASTSWRWSSFRNLMRMSASMSVSSNRCERTLAPAFVACGNGAYAVLRGRMSAKSGCCSWSCSMWLSGHS